MTYREALKNSMDPIEDLGHIIPIVWPHFLASMALVIDVNISTKISASEKDIEKVNLGQILRVIRHDDLINSMSLYYQLLGFVKWLFDQEIPEEGHSDEYDAMWYDTMPMIDKWNEYASQCNKGELD